MKLRDQLISEWSQWLKIIQNLSYLTNMNYFSNLTKIITEISTLTVASSQYTNFSLKGKKSGKSMKYSKVFSLNKSKGFDFDNKDIWRPGWDKYFMRLAEVVSSRSNCMKRAVGALIVQDNRIVSTGYNGTPFGFRNCSDGGCERCNGFSGAG